MIKLNINIREISSNISLLDENLNNSFISGNKIRKLKGILSGIENLQGLLTYGTKYSSHCLATAYYGKLLNIPVKLIILSEKLVDENHYPHLKMAKQLGADLIYSTKKVAYQFIEEKQKEFYDFHWIPGGGHTLDAAKEYETLFENLFQKNVELRNKVKSVILPFGTGTTAFGIYKGLLNVNCNVEVIGVSVSRNKDTCEKTLIELDGKLDYGNLLIIDDYAGEYEKRTEATEAARNRFFKETGVLVDPIYNAKAIECFYRYNLKNTLIVNTGGMLNNFL
jgi:1-aminocyclopropane-1-carboxylate deaminase/D-cysteine desulfhydrase-like pyridoxal-dependent ACC family enzyme